MKQASGGGHPPTLASSLSRRSWTGICKARAPAGQHKDAAPAGAQSARDRARPPETPAQLPSAPDRHPDGPGLQARSVQLIERAALQFSPDPVRLNTDERQQSLRQISNV